MKKRIFAVLLATMFIIACCQIVGLAAYDTETDESNGNSVHIEGVYSPEEANADPDYSYNTTIEMLGEVTRLSNDFKTVEVTFAVLTEGFESNKASFTITYSPAVLRYVRTSGTFLGKSAVGYAQNNSTTGTVVLTFPEILTNGYPFVGSITISFEVIVVPVSKSTNVFLAGTAYSKDDGVMGVGRATASSAVTVIFCNHLHTYDEVHKRATCQSKGEIYTYCSDCKMIIDMRDIPVSTEHSLQAVPTKVNKEPTCTEKGNAEYICRVCGRSITTDIPALGHTLGAKYSETANGKTIWYQKCSVCLETVVSATQCAHEESKYVLVVPVSKPTCTVAGKGTYKCSVCNEYASLVIPATGHNFVFQSTKVAATTTSKGIATYVCNNKISATETCGVTEDREIPMLASHTTHTYTGKEEIITPATCTSAGKKKVYCSVTGCTESNEVAIPATGHKYSTDGTDGWKVTTAVTCTTDGTRTRTCINCNVPETQTVKATGHSWSEWAVTANPTCVATGVQVRKCSVCQATESGTVPTSTKYCVYPEANYVVTKEATCMSVGVRECKCSVCNNTTDQILIPINPDAHSWGDWKVISESTCITQGERTRTCNLCGKSETDIVPAAGHTYADVSSKKGVTVKICSVCKTTETLKTTKNGTVRDIQNGICTLVFTDATVIDKDIFFNVNKMTSEEYNAKILPFEEQIKANGLGTVEAAYTYDLKIGDTDATVASASQLVITLGDEYAKTSFNIHYLDENGTLKVISSDYIKRKGTAITIDISSGTFKYPTNTLVLINTGVKTQNTIIPLVVAIITIVVAAGVVFFVISKNRKVD